MIVYSIIMFAAAIAFIVFAILISKGNTNLINCYHEDRTPNKLMYCKKISQSLFILADTLVCSGVVALLARTDAIVLLSLGVLVAGMIFGVARLFHAQKKYGGGVF